MRMKTLFYWTIYITFPPGVKVKTGITQTGYDYPQQELYCLTKLSRIL